MTRSGARVAAAAIVAVPLLGYPLVVAVDGARFPSPEDCVHKASPDEPGELDLVFGRRDTIAEAELLLDRVQGVGYVDAEVNGDGCGRWKVIYDGITSYDQGANSIAEAQGALRDAGLEAWLEIQPPG